ncbi:MAG: cupin domain-containing protein [Chloroherpetonaceae bacterium]|nr:cupin domain-containing protein [Chloroherpetonaceae bacterium]MCS7210777.1 cupin domain-containing protein [Chloroherpetonaceae bacterium]MDW8019933.1 cupin domain-containing protein [Chloroherpetonaceae bacterium]
MTPHTYSKAQYLIAALGLQAHPEGGFFREVYRSQEMIAHTALPARFSGERCFGTSIYFLLRSDDFSAFHRIQSDEIWHFYDGSPLALYMLHQDGTLQTVVLGRAIEDGQVFQATVPAQCWFAAKVTQPDSFALTGCTVAPGFDFADFELASRQKLIEAYPQHRQLIEALTRERIA